MNKYQLHYILLYAKEHNMMDKPFTEVYDSYLRDYASSIEADVQLMMQEELV